MPGVSALRGAGYITKSPTTFLVHHAEYYRKIKELEKKVLVFKEHSLRREIKNTHGTIQFDI